jgi:hypothetical protein
MDHLVTRMRRNSENLLVLAGEEPVRKWSEPVPLTDVVRAAASEIEQYGRVLLDIQPGIVVSGHAAADVVHLLAEIIENATTFSPDQTPVRVFGQEVSSGGVMLEVTDRGIGISAGRLSDMNWRLENPPLIDVSVSQHMGLFAVSRLAARSGVRIRLRAAAPQGLSALVWLPGTLAGKETARDAEERSRRLAEGAASSAGLRPGGRRARGGAGQAGAGNRRASNWFRARRPSEQRVPAGTSASTSASAPAAVPAAAPVSVPAASAVPSPVMSASGAPSRPAPSLGPRPGKGPAQPLAAADLTASGLPLRRPGANLFPGSIDGAKADDPGPDEAQEAAGTPDSPGTGGPARSPRQGPPLRRSPESARSRLSGFQLGSREAEAGLPGAGEETSR